MTPALLVYAILGTIFFLVTLPYVLVRFIQHPREMAERMGWTGPRIPGTRPLWIHAASLGELEALRVLLSDPARRFAPPLLLTVLSVSARRRAPERIPPAVPVCFAPLDFWFALIPFLSRVRPRGLVLAETELWPLTVAFCQIGHIPVAVVSGRVSRRKWSRTRRLRFLLRPLMNRMDGAAVQTSGDADRFRELGARTVWVTGNLKYRLDPAGPGEPPHRPHGLPLLFVAGSLRLGEETVLDAARANSPACLCVLAPRHLRERDHWIGACRERGQSVVLRSRSNLDLPDRRVLLDSAGRRDFRRMLAGLLGPPGEDGAPAVLLLDTHGELGRWYAAADAAFVGGTLAPIGGHNLFEPAREGIPLTFGPHTQEVRDLAVVLEHTGGGFGVRDWEQLSDWLTQMEADEATRRRAGAGALEAAREVAGAAERTWTFLGSLPWAQVSAGRPGLRDGEQEDDRAPRMG